MTSNVAIGRYFAELSNGHGFSIAQAHSKAENSKTNCSLFFFAIVVGDFNVFALGVVEKISNSSKIYRKRQ